MKTMDKQVKEDYKPMKGENNGNEEPVEERSDKIYDQSDKNNDKKDPKIDTPSPEPGKTEKKIPHLRNSQ